MYTFCNYKNSKGEITVLSTVVHTTSFFISYFSELPLDDAKWSKNNFRGWPTLMYEDLDYMMGMRAFRSLFDKNYVERKWFGAIYDCKAENLHFFKVAVTSSQPGIWKGNYKSWAVVSDSNNLTGHCTCPAGAGQSCSLIAAILYAVTMARGYDVAGETCTYKAKVCVKGASKILQSHENFATIIKDSALKKSCNDNLSKSRQFLTYEDLQEFVDRSPLKP